MAQSTTMWSPVFSSGTGTVLLDGDLRGTFTLGTGADSPTLVVNGGLISNSSLTVPAGATQAGTGLVTKPTVTVRGTLAPGDPISLEKNVAALSFSGNVVFASTASLVIELRGSGPFGNDKLSVAAAGTVTANGARITLAPPNPLTVGMRLTLIDNAGTQPIDNTPAFRQPSGASITEGTVVTVGTNSFRYSFTGGDGNDLTLTVVLSASSGSREWDAGGAHPAFQRGGELDRQHPARGHEHARLRLPGARRPTDGALSGG
jgi:hypothetical protein